MYTKILNILFQFLLVHFIKNKSYKKYIYISKKKVLKLIVSLSEWLRSLTRNQMGSARAGSIPAADDFFF